MATDRKVEIKIDKMLDKIAKIDSTLAAQHESLKEHMRRSDALEKYIESVEKDVTPLQAHVNMVKGAGKVIAVAGSILALIFGIIKLTG